MHLANSPVSIHHKKLGKIEGTGHEDAVLTVRGIKANHDVKVSGKFQK
jgi:hypothetical protein